MSSYYRHPGLKHLWITTEGYAVEKDGVRYPNRPDGVHPQEYRHYLRHLMREKRREREERGG